MKKVYVMMLVLLGLSLTGYGTVIPMHNPGFEDHVLSSSEPATNANCPWYVVSGGDSYIYKTEGIGGSQSFSLAPNNLPSNSNYLTATLYSLPTYANVGDTITLSFYSDAWRGYPDYLLSTDLNVYFYNAETPYQGVASATIAIAGAGYGWQQYSSSFILPAGISVVNAAFSFAPTTPMTYSIYFDNFSASAVPEPATLGLLSLGLIGLLRRRRV